MNDLATHISQDLLPEANGRLRDLNPREIIEWAVAQSSRVITTTSFGKNAAATIHACVQVDPKMPVVWVDTGYNLRDTYVVAERLIESMSLNMHVYTPEMTSERRNAIMGGIPTVEDEELHTKFTEQVKLEPFRRAIAAHAPEIWITGIRREETEHRKSLDILSWDSRGILKVAPFFYFSDEQLQAYMDENELISCRHYFDPTKVSDGRECGLHTSA